MAEIVEYSLKRFFCEMANPDDCIMGYKRRMLKDDKPFKYEKCKDCRFLSGDACRYQIYFTKEKCKDEHHQFPCVKCGVNIHLHSLVYDYREKLTCDSCGTIHIFLNGPGYTLEKKNLPKNVVKFGVPVQPQTIKYKKPKDRFSQIEP
jgi:hypothetical protein